MTLSNDRKIQRVLKHTLSLASTMKTGQRKFVPRQQINNGKVIVEKGSGNKYTVYALSNKKYETARGKDYGLSVYHGSTENGISGHGEVAIKGSYLYKKLRPRLLTTKTGVKRYKEGSSGSKGG